MAASIPVSLAAINVSKLLTLLVAGGALIGALWRKEHSAQLAQLRSVPVLLAMLAALTLSLAYTTAPWHDALGDIAKYGKLLLIPAVVVLIRTPREARLALGVYLGFQAFVVLTSWLLFLQVPVFWGSPTPRNSIATVYSSYLDQSIMTAAFAAICWQLRDKFPGRQGPWIAVALAAMAAVNVMVMLPGRSGQVALLGVISLALVWAVPRRWLVAAVMAPVLLAGAAMAVSPQFNERLSLVVSEISAYRHQQDATTSSGMRLNFWQRSLQAISQRPLTGFGVGSWNQQYLRLEGSTPIPGTAEVRNPHQEFLLWGVHLGVGGTLLLLGFMLLAAHDAQRFPVPQRHAMQSLLAVLAIACLFNSSLFDALIGDFFCGVLGLLLAYGLYNPDDPAPSPAPA
ncbi:MAG: O-antigen ligase family protein [Ramlibacter sp.]|nr:O-antigen ligase family protein [Ramlibacter sp.]